MLTSEVYTEARALLNDSGATRYTDAQLLPFVKRAYDELQNVLVLMGAAPVIEHTQSIAVAVGIDYLTGGTLPNALLEPIYLEEKANAVSEIYTPMRPVMFRSAPIKKPQTLGEWSWYENTIYFPIGGASTARDVTVFYLKSLTSIVDGTTPLEILNGKSFLSAKTAAMIVAFVDNDLDRAVGLNELAQTSLEVLIGTETRRQQSTPVKRLPFGFSRRMGRTSLRDPYRS